MTTPENGTLLFRGKSGRSYSLSFYNSDVTTAYSTLSLNGLAGTGSQNFWLAPEPITLVDISITTGNTVTTVGQIQINDIPIGATFAWANQLSTLNNRPIPNIPIPAGAKFTLVQL